MVMITGKLPGAGSALWGSGFLPSLHQGVELRSQGDPVLFLSDPPGVTRDDRRRYLCLFIDTDKEPTEVKRDQSAESNVGYAAPDPTSGR